MPIINKEKDSKKTQTQTHKATNLQHKITLILVF